MNCVNQIFGNELDSNVFIVLMHLHHVKCIPTYIPNSYVAYDYICLILAYQNLTLPYDFLLIKIFYQFINESGLDLISPL